MSQRMHTARSWVLQYWPRHRQKALYLVVGEWNTLVSYGCFAVLYYLLNKRLPPSVILAIGYAAASVNGYLTFRYIVFAPVRHAFVGYVRYQAVYLPILAINLVALPLALTYTNLNAYIVQALFGIFAVVAGYVGNKHFAFSTQTKD